MLRFRALGREDFGLLSTWLAAPHVRTWWRENDDPGSLEARYGPAIDGADTTECFIVERDGLAIGFVQRYRLKDNPEWQQALRGADVPRDGAGIDYLVGAEDRVGPGPGPGPGPEIIDSLVADTWARYPEVTAIMVDVSVDNRRSWRALEKAAFVRVWSGGSSQTIRAMPGSITSICVCGTRPRCPAVAPGRRRGADHAPARRRRAATVV